MKQFLRLILCFALMANHAPAAFSLAPTSSLDKHTIQILWLERLAKAANLPDANRISWAELPTALEKCLGAKDGELQKKLADGKWALFGPLYDLVFLPEKNGKWSLRVFHRPAEQSLLRNYLPMERNLWEGNKAIFWGHTEEALAIWRSFLASVGREVGQKDVEIVAESILAGKPVAPRVEHTKLIKQIADLVTQEAVLGAKNPEIELEDHFFDSIHNTSFFQTPDNWVSELEYYVRDLIVRKESTHAAREMVFLSAGSSYGPEAFSMAGIIRSALQKYAAEKGIPPGEQKAWVKTWRIRVDAADNAMGPLFKTKRGIYKKPPTVINPYVKKYLTPGFQERGVLVQMDEDLRACVQPVYADFLVPSDRQHLLNKPYDGILLNSVFIRMTSRQAAKSMQREIRKTVSQRGKTFLCVNYRATVVAAPKDFDRMELFFDTGPVGQVLERLYEVLKPQLGPGNQNLFTLNKPAALSVWRSYLEREARRLRKTDAESFAKEILDQGNTIAQSPYAKNLLRAARDLFSTSYKLPSYETEFKLEKHLNKIPYSTALFRKPEGWVPSLQEYLHDLVRNQDRAGQRKIRFLSAGASTGAEAYSVAALIANELDRLADAKKLHGINRESWWSSWDVQIVAADKALGPLFKAARGIYTDSEDIRASRLAHIRAYCIAPHFKRDHGLIWASDRLRSWVKIDCKDLADPLDRELLFQEPFDGILFNSVLGHLGKQAARDFSIQLSRYLSANDRTWICYGHQGKTVISRKVLQESLELVDPSLSRAILSSLKNPDRLARVHAYLHYLRMQPPVHFQMEAAPDTRLQRLIARRPRLDRREDREDFLVRLQEITANDFTVADLHWLRILLDLDRAEAAQSLPPETPPALNSL